MPSIEVTPVVDYGVRKLCMLSYPGHKNGCPNYKKADRCPPSAPLIRDVIDLAKPVFAIYNVFQLHEHVARMKEKHPTWSDRQLRNCLYWQPSARAVLKVETQTFLREHPTSIIVRCPEGCGVNLTATMRNAGIELEWPPVQVAYQIVLAGFQDQGPDDDRFPFEF